MYNPNEKSKQTYNLLMEQEVWKKTQQTLCYIPTALEWSGCPHLYFPSNVRQWWKMKRSQDWPLRLIISFLQQ